MGYAEDIRTIAKTKEIMDKADKAFKAADEAKKEAIKIQRIQVAQDGDGSKDAQIGNNGSGDSTSGTGVGDTVVEAPLAPPERKEDDQNTESSQTDSGSNSANNNGIEYKGQTPQNNLDQYASEQSNSSAGGTGSTRTESKEQADPENTSGSVPTSQELEDYIAKRDAMIANGATQEELDRMRIEHFSKEKGKHEVGDTAEGKSGPKPAYVPPTYSSPPLNNVIDLDKPHEVLNAVVGIDPDDPSKIVELRFDGKSVIPSIEEAVAAGQLEWTSLTEAPLKEAWQEFQQGYHWTVSNPAAATTDAPRTTMDLAIERIRAAFPAPYPTGYGDAHWDRSSLAPSGVNYTATWYQGPGTGGPPNNVTILRDTCVAVDEATCPIEAERETSYPAIDHWSLSLEGGHWIHSVFDTEVPAKYKGQTSAVKIKSAITGNDYFVEPTYDGGFMIYDAANPAYLLIYNADRTFRNPVPADQYRFYAPRPA